MEEDKRRGGEGRGEDRRGEKTKGKREERREEKKIGGEERSGEKKREILLFNYFNYIPAYLIYFPFIIFYI